MRQLAVVAATAVSLLAPGAADAQLRGTITSGGTISLVHANGAPVTQLAAGTYTIEVSDEASLHNFHLDGTPAMTGVSETGKYSFTVTLTDGAYTYRCDVHPEISGSFTVGNATSPPPPPPPDTTAPQTTITAAAPARTRLATARFAFRADEPGSKFQCKLDGGPWKRCASPRVFRALKKGRHVFQVRATDPAGNQDATPARRAWRRV